MIGFRQPITVRFISDTREGSFLLTFRDEEDTELFSITRGYTEVEAIYFLLYRELLKLNLRYLFDADATEVLVMFAEGGALDAVSHPDAHTLYAERSDVDFAEWLPIEGYRNSILRMTFDATTQPKGIDVSLGSVLLLMMGLAREIRAAQAHYLERDMRENPEDFED